MIHYRHWYSRKCWSEWFWKVNKATSWCSRTPWQKWVNGCSPLSRIYPWLWCLIKLC